jgi:hypothetical protein
MAGMGMLSTALAGAVKGGADVAVDLYKQQNEFQLNKALREADYDMRARLEAAGIRTKQAAADEERGKVAKVIAEADSADPNAGKGGYETPEIKAKAERDGLERRRQKLTDAGYLDEADRIDGQLVRRDKSEAAGMLADYKNKQLDANIDRWNRDRQTREEIADANTKARVAQIEAAGARSANKLSDDEKEYQAYVNRVKTQGAKDAAGRISYNPWSFDKWMDLKRDKDAMRKSKADTSREEVETDADGNVLSRKKITTSKAPPPGKGRGGEDPLGLFK